MPDSAPSDPLQTIADLQRELAQARAERDEALAQQTATAEVLQVINSSPGDLAPVFEAMLEKALALCGAPYGVLVTFDGESFHTVAGCGHPEFDAWVRQREPHRPGPGSTLERFIGGEDIVHIPDIADNEAYRAGNPRRRAMVDVVGARTLIGIALRKDDVLLGALQVYRREVRAFSDKQIALLQNFAAQAVIAMENARLITETKEALDQQTATAEVLGVINSSPGDLTPVFEAMLGKALRLCGASFGNLLRYDGELFDVAAVVHADREVGEGFRRRVPFSAPPGSVLDRIVRGEDVTYAEDIRKENEYFEARPEFREMVDAGRYRSLLDVALRKEGALVGIIGIFRQEVRPFTDKQIALLQNFAAQAVIAMESARLMTETREALDQQTATAEVLQVINSSPGDLAPVFDAMLEKALRLCGAAYGQLSTYDGEQVHPVAVHGDPQLVEHVRQRGPFRPRPDGFLGRIVGGEDVVYAEDMRQYEGYRTNPFLREMADIAGQRATLSVALRKDDTLVGIFGLWWKEVRPFNEKQIALVQNFAAQAVIAMENARLLTETREALDQQTATAEVLQVINASPGDLTPVFEAMLEKAIRLCDGGYGSLLSYDGQRFSVMAVAHAEPQLAEWHRNRPPFEPTPGGPLHRVVNGEQVVIIEDVQQDEGYRNGIVQFRGVVDAGGYRSLLNAALRKDATLLGNISIFRKEAGPFTDKQIALLQNFAAQAVIAMENARLITETHEALEQQTATAEVLGVINSSPGDLAPVFDAILQKAHALCGAAKGALVTYEGERFRAVATRGLSEAYALLLRAPQDNPPGSPPRRLLDGESLVQVPDMAALAFPIPRAAAQLEGIRTVLYVPLRKDGVLLGFITAYRQEVRPFSDKQIALLQNFAAQAVIAMENARLLGELRERTEEIAGWNKELEARVAAQLAEIERTGKLRRFLAPQLADLIVAQGDESILESHRREIVVVFCDLRGFTAFAERAEPEEVMALLRDYHAAMGPIVARFEGTIDHYGGDGIMVFFNDPLPTPDPARRAIDMAVAMRAAAQDLLRAWRRHGHDIGFGVGISQGYATLGQIGFAERMDYTAIGTVTNLAARLCGEAKDGQILVSSRVATAIEGSAHLEEVGDLSLKGLSQAVVVYNVPQ